MNDSIPPPVLEDLVPPLLAHLPTAFASKNPPTSLFPLLAPILRNRIRLLLDPTSSDSWVSLLTWNHTNGQALDAHLATLDLGAVAEHAILRGLQRIDEETLKASAELCDWGLIADYTWSTNDPDGEDDGWRVLDVHLSSCADDASQWHPSVSAAEEAFAATRKGRTFGAAPSAPVETEEDDSYWNMYDQSSPTTPAPRETEEPDEDSYFDRYNDVEPVLGSAYDNLDEEETFSHEAALRRYSSSNNTALSNASTPPTAVSSTTCTAPRPISADSSDFVMSKLAAKLEQSAAESNLQAEMAAKQHVSTSIKSLFRLCRAVGIEQEEFHSMVETELAMLSMMDHDE